jgi:PAS domain-containing protein
VSKESFALSKWLILRAREHNDARVDAFGGDSNTRLDGRGRAVRPRLPTGDHGLPSDWLFSMAIEPVVIAEATTHRIVQANPAAAELLGSSQAALIGSRLPEVFDSTNSQDLMRSLDAASMGVVADHVTCRSAGGGELRAKVSMVRAETDSFLLVRLAARTGDGMQAGSQSPVFDAIEGAAVGFVVTDSGLRVDYANQALIDMIGLASPAGMRGCSLARWLEFSATDLAGLGDQMLQRQATSVMTAGLRTERGSPLEVEVWAVAVPDGARSCWGFAIRELPRLN